VVAEGDLRLGRNGVERTFSLPTDFTLVECVQLEKLRMMNLFCVLYLVRISSV